jgi:hypothetical protein
VLHLRLIILSVGGDVSVDSETLLVTDFVNLNIKSVQSFRGAHRGRVYMHVFIGVCLYGVYACVYSGHTYMSTCFVLYFLKKYFKINRVLNKANFKVIWEHSRYLDGVR